MRNDAKLGIAAATLTMAAVLVWWVVRGAGSEDDPPAPAEVASAAKASAPRVPGLVLQPASGAVSGRDGAPLAGVRVTFVPDATPTEGTVPEPFRATTDAAGRFQLSRPAVPGQLAFSHDGYHPVSRSLDAAAPEDLVIQLEPEVTLAPEVSTAPTPEPQLVPTPDPDPDPEPGSVLDPEALPDPQPEPQAEPQADPLPEPLPETEAEPESGADLEAEPEAEAVGAPEPVVEEPPEEDREETAEAEVPAVNLPCRFQLVLEGRFAKVDGIRLLDGANGELPIGLPDGAVASSALFAAGQSGVLRASDRARVLVLLQDGDRVARLPLRLWPTDRVRTIRL